MWIFKEGDVVDWTNIESVMDNGSLRVAQTIKMRQSTYSIDRIRLSMQRVSLDTQ